MHMLRLFPLLAVCALAGCYNPNIPDGKQQCTSDDRCPEGYTCNTITHTCFKTGVTPSCSPACAAPTPFCDVSQLKCVSCLKDADCGAGELCINKSCKAGCSAQKPTCGDDAGTCDVDLGVCRGCMSDVDCSGATPRCDTATERCVPCLPKNDNCPSGQYCRQSGATFSCEPGCNDKSACVTGGDDGGSPDGGGGGTLECCDHKCVDVSTEPTHCGACGMACTGASACCAGKCADTMTDVAHCGGCGMRCSPANVEMASCTGGACGYTTCKTGFADCDGNPANGCEVNTLTSAAHCGKCNMACPGGANAMAACSAGACTITCATGFGNCDNNNSNGCEVATTTSVAHCGGCNKPCTVPNATPSCVNSVCQIAACTTPFRNCDNQVNNGCEINTSNNASHCSTCGNLCPAIANGTPGCINSACGIGSCNTNFGNCDNNPSNGCETNLLSNVSHCGGCSKPCTLANATNTCSGGACAIAACSGAFANCNGIVSDGCEVNTLNNAAHCGGCNKPCAGGQTCNNGVCGSTMAVTYSQSFPMATVLETDGQCVAWNNFRAALVGTYTAITIRGSSDPTGVTCTGSTANVLCQALRSGSAVAPVMCNGRSWAIGGCGGANNAAVELSANGNICQCNDGYIVRPCIANSNWGGVNTPTCNAPAQTMIVTCQ